MNVVGSYPGFVPDALGWGVDRRRPTRPVQAPIGQHQRQRTTGIDRKRKEVGRIPDSSIRFVGVLFSMGNHGCSACSFWKWTTTSKTAWTSASTTSTGPGGASVSLFEEIRDRLKDVDGRSRQAGIQIGSTASRLNKSSRGVRSSTQRDERGACNA